VSMIFCFVLFCFCVLFLCLVLQEIYDNAISKSPDEQTDPYIFEMSEHTDTVVA